MLFDSKIWNLVLLYIGVWCVSYLNFLSTPNNLLMLTDTLDTCMLSSFLHLKLSKRICIAALVLSCLHRSFVAIISLGTLMTASEGFN